MKDLNQSVRKIAAFLNIKLSEEQIERVVVGNTFANKMKEGGLHSKLFLRKGWLATKLDNTM